MKTPKYKIISEWFEYSPKIGYTRFAKIRPKKKKNGKKRACKIIKLVVRTDEPLDVLTNGYHEVRISKDKK